MEIDFSQSAPKPATLQECHALVVSLWNFCAELQKEVLRLKNEILALKPEIAALKKENTELKKQWRYLKKPIR